MRNHCRPYKYEGHPIMSPSIRVAIIDDHPVVREGLRVFLSVAPDICVAGVFSQPSELLTQLPVLNLDIIVVDLVIPGEMDGISLIRTLSVRNQAIRTIALTSFEDAERCRAALNAGASAYLPKSTSPESLLGAIRQTYQGQIVLDAKAWGWVHDDRPPTPLTPREFRVLQSVAQGLSNKEIAASLGAREKTIKSHISQIFRKLHVQDRTQAVVRAHELGLISLPSPPPEGN